MRTLTLILAGLALLLAPAASLGGSATPDPALRYRVSGVAAGDQLNVRQQPGVGGDVIGALAPHAEDIVITGAVTDEGGSQWWEVVFIEGYLSRGWVNGSYLAPQQDAEGETNYPLLCAGTEPFWSIDIGNDGRAAYSDPNVERVPMSAGPWVMASGMTGRFAVELKHEAQIGWAAIWRDAVACSDGMSDIRYPFGTLLIRPDGEVLGGCCRRLQ